MHHLGYRIRRRVCCYSNGEPPFNHSFYKDQKPSHSQTVLGLYKLNHSWHLGWRSWSGSVDQLVILERYDFVKFYLPTLHRKLPLIFFPFVSLTNIAMISVERFHATFRPFKHRLIKRWVYVVAITVVWVFPVIAAVIWVLEWLDAIVFDIYLWESYCCLCLIVTFVSYTSILFKFRYGAHPQRHCAAALRQRKLTVTLLITTLASLLLWLPYNTYFFVFRLTDSVNLFPTPARRPLLSSFLTSIRWMLKS